eukprot:2424098-Pyramimonas_sp.AAC.1
MTLARPAASSTSLVCGLWGTPSSGRATRWGTGEADGGAGGSEDREERKRRPRAWPSEREVFRGVPKQARREPEGQLEKGHAQVRVTRAEGSECKGARIPLVAKARAREMQASSSTDQSTRREYMGS